MSNFKYILLICFSLFFVDEVKAQHDKADNEMKTVFQKKNSYGGYGSLSYRYSQIDKRNVFVNGGRGAWLINHSLGIGFAGYAFKSKSKIDEHFDDLKFRFSGGYGGVLLEPIVGSNRKLHLTLPVVIGGGGFSYRQKAQKTEEEFVEDRDFFFLIEPGAELEINIFRFMRIDLGFYYRITSETHLNYANDEAIAPTDVLHGLSYGISFKFGRF